MRLFLDTEGNRWDVVVGRESYGTVVVLFFPRTGSESPREALLDVSSPEEGSRLLREFSDDEVLELFRGSAEKTT